MALLKVTLFLTFAVLVNALPQFKAFDKADDWQQTATINSLTTVSDGSSKLLAVVNITVNTWNFQDSYSLLSSTVRRNLANIPVDSEVPHDTLRVYEVENAKPLPLLYNRIVSEVVATGPSHRRVFAMYLQMDIYANKKHRSYVLEGLKNFSL